MRLLLALLALGLVAADDREEWIVLEARRLVDPGVLPPSDDDPRWRVTRLDTESRDTAGDGAEVDWYRLELRVSGSLRSIPGRGGEHSQAGEQIWAVYVPVPAGKIWVFANGALVGVGNEPRRPVATGQPGEPFYVTFPQPALDSEVGYIDLRVEAAFSSGLAMGPVYMGPDSALRRRYERRLLWQSQLPMLSTGLAATMTILIVALWVVSRFAGLYGWLALATFLFTLSSVDYWIQELPLDRLRWVDFVQALRLGFPVAFVCWVHRLVDLSRPRVELALFALVCAAMLLALVAPGEVTGLGMNEVNVLAALLGGYGLTCLFQRRHVLSPLERVAYPLTALLVLGVGIRDLVLYALRIPGSLYLSPLFVPCFFLICAALLVYRASLAVPATRKGLDRGADNREEARRGDFRLHHERIGQAIVSSLGELETGAPRVSVIRAVRTALDEVRAAEDSISREPGPLGSSEPSDE